MRKHFAWGVLLVSTLTSGLQAQFHAKTQTGQTGVNQQAVNSAQQQTRTAAMAGPAAAGLGGGMAGGDMILPEGQRQALSRYGVKLSQMTGKPVDIWGRAIHHSDGSFTESKQDNKTNTLLQTTFSKNLTKMQTRMITLDQMGRPSEAMIYDARDQFKYRGLQIYDTFGRFSEEQIYDAKGTLIRRKVQEYSPRGEKLPVRSWNYVANVPEDLKLVITRDEEQGATAPPPPPVKAKSGFFGGGAKSAPVAQVVPVAPAATQGAASAAPETKKGLNLGRFFSGRKSE